jgi:hypothetical protein
VLPRDQPRIAAHHWRSRTPGDTGTDSLTLQPDGATSPTESASVRHPGGEPTTTVSVPAQDSHIGSASDQLPGEDGAAAPAHGSSVVASSPLPSPEQPRRRTCLQAGDRKPNVYTDGTIRYCFLTSTGEPCTVEEALGDKNWKSRWM